jgi:hypothetical protein
MAGEAVVTLHGVLPDYGELPPKAASVRPLRCANRRYAREDQTGGTYLVALHDARFRLNAILHEIARASEAAGLARLAWLTARFRGRGVDMVDRISNVKERDIDIPAHYARAHEKVLGACELSKLLFGRRLVIELPMV